MVLGFKIWYPIRNFCASVYEFHNDGFYFFSPEVIVHPLGVPIT